MYTESFQELDRGFSLFSLIGLAFAILNSWVAMSASMSLALPSGGPTAAIWGILLSGAGSLAMAASLAEICSSYPVGEYLCMQKSLNASHFI